VENQFHRRAAALADRLHLTLHGVLMPIGLEDADASQLRDPELFAEEAERTYVEALELKGMPGHYAVGNSIPPETFKSGDYTITVKVVAPAGAAMTALSTVAVIHACGVPKSRPMLMGFLP